MSVARVSTLKPGRRMMIGGQYYTVATIAPTCPDDPADDRMTITFADHENHICPATRPVFVPDG